jgi:predicted transcriptional regulator
MARIAGSAGGGRKGMKAVLISIRPKWCEKIISGEKTIEVRKTRPKLNSPFKCYIYCTRNGQDPDRLWVLNDQARKEYDGLVAVCANLRECQERHFLGNGKVIGEFTCDKIYDIQKRGIPENFDYCYLSLNEWGNDDIETEIKAISASCVSKEELNVYGAGTPVLYGWHISNLRIYDHPRDLWEFTGLRQTKYGLAPGPITRPPQSWRYVEEELWND